MTRFAAATLMWGALTLGACSAEPLGLFGPLVPSRDGAVDTFTSVDSLGADRCTGSLSDLGTKCPTSFDGTAADLPACSYPGQSQTVTACGDVTALVRGGGFGGVSCYYDAATHVLVGALEVSDSPGFCGDSFGRFYGQVPGASCATTPFLRRICSSDGGTG